MRYSSNLEYQLSVNLGGNMIEAGIMTIRQLNRFIGLVNPVNLEQLC